MRTFISTQPLPARVKDFLATSPANDVAGTSELHRATAPFTGEEIFAFPRATGADVEVAVERARGGVESGGIGRGDRRQVLLRLHDLVQANEELILDLIQLENGKSRAHAYDELMDLYNCARFYGRNVSAAFGDRRCPGAIPGLTKTRTQYYPLGVVGLISPWNYPLSLGVGDVLAALSAGNAVVHKPDSQTTLTAIYLRRLAIGAGLPDNAWILVPGRGAEVGDALVPLVDGLSFTGSTAAGSKLAKQAAGRLIPTMMELGGKNPAIVLDDADLPKVAEGIVRAAYSSSGQLCMSTERLYISTGRKEEFLRALTEALDREVLGASFSDAATIGSLTGSRQLETVKRHIDDAGAKGATVVYGGHHRPDLGPYFFEPTVLTGVTREMECFSAETFGPVLSVYGVDSVDEAIAAANDTSYGLAASVWGSDSRSCWEVASRLEAGMVNINEGFAAAYGSIAAPGGGAKNSGLNHRHGITGMRLWANERTVAEQRLHPLAPSELLPPARFRKVVSTSLGLLKRSGLRV